MSLAERLASAQRDRGQPNPSPSNGDGTDGGQPRRTSAISDPLGALKQVVHQALLANLGPKLYDAELPPSELEQMVRIALQQEVALTQTPLSNVDRTRLTQEIADDILGYGPIEPFLRDPELTEIMVNGPFDIWI
jgi:pilus assembly protein CpaF